MIVAAELRAAIKRFRAEAGALEEQAAAVLDRLAADDWAHLVLPAFDVVPPKSWPILIHDCLWAKREMRRHKAAVEYWKTLTAKADKAADGLAEVAKFVAFERQMADGPDPVGEALHTLRLAIKNAQRDARRELTRHSQKTDPTAARAVGIGWIEGSLRALAPPGTRNLRVVVAELATAALGDGEITEDMVRHAPKPRERLDLSYGRRRG